MPSDADWLNGLDLKGVDPAGQQPVEATPLPPVAPTPAPQPVESSKPDKNWLDDLDLKGPEPQQLPAQQQRPGYIPQTLAPFRPVAPPSAPNPNLFPERKVPQNIPEFSKNVYSDIDAIGRTIKTMATIPALRAREVGLDMFAQSPMSAALPPPVQEQVKQMGGGLFRPTDLPQFAEAIKGAADYMVDRYGARWQPDDPHNPFKGKFVGAIPREGLRYPQYLAEQFGKTPLLTTMDTLPVTVPATKLFGKVGQNVAKSRIPGYGAATTLAKKELSTFPLPPWLTAFQKSSEARRLFAQKLAEADKKRQLQILKAKRELEEAARGMTPRERKEIGPVLEGTDKRLIEKWQNDPELDAKARKFANAATKYNRLMWDTFGTPDVIRARTLHGGRLLAELEEARRNKLFDLTDEYSELRNATDTQSMARKQMLLAQIKDASRPLTFEDLKQPALTKELLKRYNGEVAGPGEGRIITPEMEAEAAGKYPTASFPISTEIQTAQAMNRAAEPMGGALSPKQGRITKAAKAVQKGEAAGASELPKDERPFAWMEEREAAKIRKTPFALETRRAFRKYFSWKKEQRKRPYNWDDTMNTIRGPQHTLDGPTGLLAREIDRASFEAAFNFIDDMVKQGWKHGNTPEGWEGVNLEAELSKAGIDPNRLRKAFGNEMDRSIYLPKGLAQQLRDAIHGKAVKTYGFRGVDVTPIVNLVVFGPSKMAAKLAFTYDLMFHTRLIPQTFALQLAHIETPRDVINFVVSSTLAMNPKVWKYFTPEMLLSHGSKIDIETLRAGKTLQERLAHYDWPGHPVASIPLKGMALAEYGLESANKGRRGLEAALRSPYNIHNRQRAQVAIDYLLYKSKDAPVPIKKMIKDMFNAEDALIEAVDNLNDPAKLEAFNKHIKGIMGDYKNYNELERGAFHIYWVYGWVRHYKDIVANAGFRYPQKVAAISRLNKLSDQLGADKYGGLPVKDRSGNQVYTQEGRPKYFSGPQLIPGGEEVLNLFSNVILSVARTMAGDTAASQPKYKIPSGANPYLGTMMSQQTGVDPNTGRPYQQTSSWLARDIKGNPIVRPMEDGGYAFIDKFTGEFIPTDENVGPEMGVKFLKEMGGKQMNLLQDAISGDKEPVEGTWFERGAHPPRVKVDKHGNPIKKDVLEHFLKYFPGGYQSYSHSR